MQAYMKLCTDNESVTLQSIKTMQGSKKQLKVPAAAKSNNCIVLLTNVDAVCMYTLQLTINVSLLGKPKHP